MSFTGTSSKPGAGLSDPVLARVVADEACDRINELIALGVEFDRTDGGLVQRKLSGCTKARSLTCGGSTGREMVRVLKGRTPETGCGDSRTYAASST